MVEEDKKEPVLATKGITKSFGALRASIDISVSLFPGEIHAIIGPNGAGKIDAHSADQRCF